MTQSLESALKGRLSENLRHLCELRDANFDAASNQAKVEFRVLEYLDPVTKQCPTRYALRLRGVAITDVKVNDRSLTHHYRHDLPRMVTELKPQALDWELVVTDAANDRSAEPIELRLNLHADPYKPLAPDVFFETRIWHPNVQWQTGQACYGDKVAWSDPRLSLADLIRRIYTMMAFIGQGSVNVDARDQLNKEAARWYSELKVQLPDVFPIGNRVLQ